MFNGEEITQIMILALPKELLETSAEFAEISAVLEDLIENCPNQISLEELMAVGYDTDNDIEPIGPITI